MPGPGVLAAKQIICSASAPRLGTAAEENTNRAVMCLALDVAARQTPATKMPPPPLFLFSSLETTVVIVQSNEFGGTYPRRSVTAQA